MTLRTRIVSVSLVFSLLSPALASGDAQSDKALADQLFLDAKALMKKNDFASACPKLEESNKLDPSDGTVLNLGLCYEGLGRWATAWALFNESISRAKAAVPPRTDRIKLSKERIAVIEPKLSRVTIVVADAKVDQLEVTLDGRALGAAAWGTAMPVDPGDHTVTAKAPMKKPIVLKVTISAKKDDQKVSVPALEEETASAVATLPPPTPGDASANPTPAAPVHDDMPPAPAGGSSKTGAWIAVGIGGVLALGAGGAFLLAKSAQNDRRDFCAAQATPTCPDDTTLSRMHRWETISVVGAGAALVSIGIGVVLFASSSSSGKESARLTVSPFTGNATGLVVQSAF